MGCRSCTLSVCGECRSCTLSVRVCGVYKLYSEISSFFVPVDCVWGVEAELRVFIFSGLMMCATVLMTVSSISMDPSDSCDLEGKLHSV